MSENPGYTEAFEELRKIVSELENGGISVDILAEKIRRATVLIHICRNKLTSVEEEVNTILKELENEPGLPE